jgi:hypothetical protein
MLLPGLNEAMGSGLTLSVLEWGRAALGNSFTACRWRSIDEYHRKLRGRLADV